MEITVVLLLLSAIALPLLINSRTSSDRIRSQGLARALTEELRAARAHAAQEQTDVVLAFPSGGAWRSFRVYQGEDVLQPVRTLNFDKEYESYILAASWPATGSWQSSSTLPTRNDLPAGMSLVIFRPDGSVTSNLPRLDGAHCLVVGNAMTFSRGEGTVSELSAIKDPNTVLLRPSGTIELVERLYQASVSLPVTDAKPTLLALELDDLTGEHTPVIDSISFFPRSGSVEGQSGLGKTFIEIHPVGEGERLKEYGMVTLEVEASDTDGGPLFLEVKVDPSLGSPGTLTSDGPVRMEYLNGRWKGTVGWKPPVQADSDITYSFQVNVSDRDGRVVSTRSDASVLPILTTLADNRLAVEDVDGVVYLANLEGGELVRITPPGAWESQPIWSGDGTKLYVIAREDKETSFVRYNADGTGRKTVTVFPEDAQAFQVDRSGMYLGFLHSETKATYDTLSKEGFAQKSSLTTYSLSILHVSSGKDPLPVAGGVDGFVFLPYENGQFQTSIVKVDHEDGPAFDEGGVPIEGETHEYATFESKTNISRASGLGPEIKSSAYELSVDLDKGALNPYEPRYFAGSKSSVRSLAEGRKLEDSSFYVFQKKDGYWVDVVKLAKDVKLLEPPVWSANGDWVVYTVEEKGVRRVYAQRIQLPEPEAKHEAVVNDSIPMLEGTKVESVTPTPGGDAILYIVGTLGTPDSRLMSQRTKEGSGPVQIGVNLRGVASYAITQ